MPENPQKRIADPQAGVIDNLVLRLKLIIRLMGDRRVNFLVKLIPVGSLAYFLIPDLVIGPIDDALVVWLATYLFVELCPPDVVKEIEDELKSVIPGSWHDPAPGSTGSQDEDIIDTEFKEIK